MTAQQLTYEGFLELMQESSQKFDKEMQETRRLMKERDAEYERIRKERDAENDRLWKEAKQRFKEADKRIEKTRKSIGELTGSMGKIIEHMVCGEGNIIKKFQDLGYRITKCHRNTTFLDENSVICGEIDILLEDGGVDILVEVKTTLTMKYVRKHIKQLKAYRHCANAKGDNKSRFIGAVAGAIVKEDAKNFAHKNGMYVIVQSGKAVDIVKTPEGFTAKEW